MTLWFSLSFSLSLSIITDRSQVASKVDGERKEICILLGIIRLLAGELLNSTQSHMTVMWYVGPYLIVGTKHRLVGTIGGHEIYEMTHYDIIPFFKSTLHLTQSQVKTKLKITSISISLSLSLSLSLFFSPSL